MEESHPVATVMLDSVNSAATDPPPTSEPTYAGYTRFELELEVCVSYHFPTHSLRGAQFVQSLASPAYLSYLASKKYFEKSEFVAYLDYLQYFTRPEYIGYLTYPGPTLRHLELLQQEQFRKDLGRIDVVAALMEEGQKAAVEWPST